MAEANGIYICQIQPLVRNSPNGTGTPARHLVTQNGRLAPSAPIYNCTTPREKIDEMHCKL